jgi:hypothetical protein
MLLDPMMVRSSSLVFVGLNKFWIDPQSVLDGDFHVRGVQNLRVVDASSWPEIPGYFPTSPTYMVSNFQPIQEIDDIHLNCAQIAEKAAQVILRDAKRA